MKRFSEASEAFLRKFMKKKDKYYNMSSQISLSRFQIQ